MANFGWSYPAGCSGTPYDAPDPPCEVCMVDVDSCVCLECVTCHSQGDPKCYTEHGMKHTKLQLRYRAHARIAQLEEEIRTEKMFLEELDMEDAAAHLKDNPF